MMDKDQVVDVGGLSAGEAGPVATKMPSWTFDPFEGAASGDMEFLWDEGEADMGPEWLWIAVWAVLVLALSGLAVLAFGLPSVAGLGAR